MGNLILINDVLSNFDDDNLIAGNSLDAYPSKLGEQQSIDIAVKVQPLLSGLNLMAYSKSPRISKLIHHIKTKSVNGRLANVETRISDLFQERSFGVLNGSQFALDSDLFTHTRICAEDGESISKVKERFSSGVYELCAKNKKVLIVSHPFACQIVFNFFLSKKHTALTKFWMTKGSVSVLEFAQGKFGFRWNFHSAENLLEQKEYTLDEIYSEPIKCTQ